MAMCHLTHVKCNMSCFRYNMSHIMCLPVTCHMLPVTYLPSHLTNPNNHSQGPCPLLTPPLSTIGWFMKTQKEKSAFFLLKQQYLFNQLYNFHIP